MLKSLHLSIWGQNVVYFFISLFIVINMMNAGRWSVCGSNMTNHVGLISWSELRSVITLSPIFAPKHHCLLWGGGAWTKARRASTCWYTTLRKWHRSKVKDVPSDFTSFISEKLQASYAIPAIMFWYNSMFTHILLLYFHSEGKKRFLWQCLPREESVSLYSCHHIQEEYSVWNSGKGKT